MLTLVSTPIGNLGDMPPRGVTALQDADLVLCEDTRVTRKLTTRFGIETRLMALHDHNEQQMVEGVLNRYLQGAMGNQEDVDVMTFKDQVETLSASALEALSH